MFDKNKFLSVLVLKGKTVQDVADYLGIHKITLYNKINGKSDFYLKEVSAIRDYLELSDVTDIFFAKEIT